MFIVKSFIKAFVIAGIVALLAGGTVYYQIDGTEVEVDKLMITPSPTVLYDKDGNPFTQFHQQIRYFTPFEDIPEEMIDAIISIEDRNFYEHAGISVEGIARALVANVKAGSSAQGGSTLTQQLIKRIYLNPGKTLERKIEEAIYSAAVEEHLTKEDIVSLYLNHIFYGNNAYGVEDAILTYFGETIEAFKNDEKINRIAKAALLAGIPQTPSLYNPYLNPEETMKKRNTVLQKMLEEGKITKQEHALAVEKPFLILKEPKIVADDEIVRYPEITHYVLEEARKTLDLPTIEDVIRSGTKIYTSFDPKVYETIRSSFEKDELHPKNAGDGTKTQASAVFLNPQNGEILAFTGARERNETFLDFNRAFQMKRQPGSTFKPIIAYGPALEHNKMHPWSLVASRNGACFGNYCVKGGSSSAYATMETALTYSWNVSAVWLLDQVGIKKATEFAKKQGITTWTDRDVYLPIALGGLDKGVSPLEMADSYQGFATGGVKVPAHIVRRIVAHNGDILHEAQREKTRVMKEETANYMRYMLRNVVLKGTGTPANTAPEHMVAGKTGTTEVPWKGSSQNKDIWFVGFTKDYVGSIWMGFDQTDKNHAMWEYSGVPARMFGDIIKPLLQDKPDLASQYKNPTPVKPEITSFSASGARVKDSKAINITWKDRGKDVFYEVYRDEERIEETEKLNFRDTGTEDGKTYSYTVVAVNKYSKFPVAASNIVSVSIPKVEDVNAPEDSGAAENTSNEEEDEEDEK